MKQKIYVFKWNPVFYFLLHLVNSVAVATIINHSNLVVLFN